MFVSVKLARVYPEMFVRFQREPFQLLYRHMSKPVFVSKGLN